MQHQGGPAACVERIASCTRHTCAREPMQSLRELCLVIAASCQASSDSGYEEQAWQAQGSPAPLAGRDHCNTRDWRRPVCHSQVVSPLHLQKRHALAAHHLPSMAWAPKCMLIHPTAVSTGTCLLRFRYMVLDTLSVLVMKAKMCILKPTLYRGWTDPMRYTGLQEQ